MKTRGGFESTATEQFVAQFGYSRFRKGRSNVRNHNQKQKFAESSPVWTLFLYSRILPPITLLLPYI